MGESRRDRCGKRSRAGGETGAKSPVLVGLTFASWLLAIVFMGGRLWPIFRSVVGPAQTIVLALLASLLVIFWLLGSYYFALVLLFFWERWHHREEPLTPRSVNPLPAIAVLYPTCDDFQREAALTCVLQEYPEFHVFLLDDSCSAECQNEVERFHREFPEYTSVVRRSNRAGFKAGNLNHALRGHASGYSAFAVMDADERLPPDFLLRMLGRLQSGDWAFVQANHEPNPRQQSTFAKALGQTILPFWLVLLSAKNRYGFVPCVGHGLVVRRTAWERAGGFPELACEDLGFSARLLELGMRGYYAQEIVCQEDFPPTLAALRWQQKRYLGGVCEAALKFWPRTMRQGRISLVEKIDFVLSCLPLYVPVFCLAFLVVLGIGMVAAFGTIGSLELRSGDAVIAVPYIRTFDDRFRPLWSPAFVALSILFSLSPAFPVLALALTRRVANPAILLVASNLAYMSTIFVSIGSVFDWVRRIPIQFRPTMARGENEEPVFAAYEGVACAILVVLLLGTLNLGLAAIAFCPIAGRWGNRPRNVPSVVAFGIFGGICIQFLLGALAASPALSLTQLAFSIHF